MKNKGFSRTTAHWLKSVCLTLCIASYGGSVAYATSGNDEGQNDIYRSSTGEENTVSGFIEVDEQTPIVFSGVGEEKKLMLSQISTGSWMYRKNIKNGYGQKRTVKIK